MDRKKTTCKKEEDFKGEPPLTGASPKYSRTSTNGHLSVTATSLQQPGFFVPTVRQSIHVTVIESSLQRPPLYNDQIILHQGGRCERFICINSVYWSPYISDNTKMENLVIYISTCFFTYLLVLVAFFSSRYQHNKRNDHTSYKKH